ncbi:MAG: two-component regulator propeller domain-containing protein [Bacteroidota bacterium]
MPLYQWRDHLSYQQGIAVAQSNNGYIYCATEGGIFSLSKQDFSIERLSKINGLSDIGVSTLRYNDNNNTLLIAYKNANIDLIDANKRVYNISDIKRTIITAKKTINNIYFRGNLAYLACGFGIVVLDMNKKEIKDTYYIGVNGGYIDVKDITADANYIYASSDVGVYRALWSSTNLANFNSWNKFSGLPKGIYNTIAHLNGKIYTNFSQPTKPWGNDTIYVYDGTAWKKLFPLAPDSRGMPVKKMETGNNKLIISYISCVDFYDANGIWTGNRIGQYQTNYAIVPYQAIIDNNDTNITWIADYLNGLTKNICTWKCAQSFSPNGPNTSKVYSMQYVNDALWVAPGDHSTTWNGIYNCAEAYQFKDEVWNSFTKFNIPALDSIRDIVSIAIDPVNTEHVYLGSVGVGLIELNNGALVKIWNETNTGNNLQSTDWGSGHWIGIFGLAFDLNRNLWITVSAAPNSLAVHKADGSWQSFYFPKNITNLTNSPVTGSILIDRYNQKWIIIPRGIGIFVFDENGTVGTSDDKMKKLTFAAGSGNIPGNEVICFAEDKEGEIWIGTDKGIGVFYCPDQVFSSKGCEAQQIFIQQDGHTQILLETEEITAIAVDGANRKWIGTRNSGVFLMSADGTKQIQYFTTDNSPLLSNEISSITINPKNGEVFFGTSSGIISYQGDATEGNEDFENVYVFPNPVQPEYDGPIAISGLAQDADVKITDITGNLVYHTKSLGGQAIWYGKNLNGQKVHSGVYLIFCANKDGTKTFISKILVIN